MISKQQLELHWKCCRILEMMQNCKKRASIAHAALEAYHRSDPLSLVRIMNDPEDYTSQIENYKRIHARLAVYYANNLCKLVEPALDKVFS